MRKTYLALAAVLACGSTFAQTIPAQENSCQGTNAYCGPQSNQHSGDVTVTNSGDTHTDQNGNHGGNQNGGSVGANNQDNRSQVTGGDSTSSTGDVTSEGSQANGNQSDNKSSASNGAQTATTGASSASNGAQTATNGGNTTGGNTMAGGDNKAEGGAGGASSSTGTNAQGQGQQQGIDKSGNSTNTLGQATSNTGINGQSSDNKNTGTNAQGQSADNKNSNGQGQGQSSANKNSNGQGQSAVNGQGQSSSNALGQKSTNTSNNGGNKTTSDAKQGQSNDGSGNSSTRVDASDRSVYNNKTIFIPAIVPPTPPSSLAVGNVIKETSACGPLQRIVEREVNGTFHGLFSTDSVRQGYHQELAPFLDANGYEVQYKEVQLPTRDGYRVYGHQVTQYTTIVGVSGARNVAIGGGGSSGSWGQGGMGTSSANQQMVTTLQLRLCEIGTIRDEPTVVIEVERRVLQEVPVKKTRE